MTDSERIQAVFKIAEQTATAVETMAARLEAEIDGRIGMCIAIMDVLIVMKNQHARLVRQITESAVFSDDKDDWLALLSDLSKIERQCERLEHIIAKAKE